MKPIRLESSYVSTIWADNYISEIRNLSEKMIGISREVSTYKGTESLVSCGEFKGKKITSVINENYYEIMGEDDSEQLIKCAYMSSADRLSIQVHMNQQQASLVDDYEKSEAWYILRAGKESYITAGVNIDDKEEIKKSIENNYLEKYLINKKVKEGDFVLIPAGLIHANGSDMLVLEIGSFGGITYRLYDYNRGRQLDIEKGLNVCDTALRASFTHHPISEIKNNNISVGVHHELFHSDVIDVYDEITIHKNNKYNIYSCVKNSCVIICEGENYPLDFMQTILIPASIKKLIIKGNCRVLRSYKP
jgi:mannose-6-phosphate isomerase